MKDPIGGGSSGSVYVYHYTGTVGRRPSVSILKLGTIWPISATRLHSTASTRSSAFAKTDDVILGNGTAHVFRYNGSQWVEHQRLHASDPTTSPISPEFLLSGGLAAVGR